MLRGQHEIFLRAACSSPLYHCVDSKQHFYLQYHVAATDVKALCEKQMILLAVAYLGFPVCLDKFSLDAPSPFVDKVFLLFLLKTDRLICQKAGMIQMCYIF